MKVKTDLYEFTVSSAYLDYFLTSELSKYTTQEIELLNQFARDAADKVHAVCDILHSMRWEHTICRNWAKCEISGFYGEVVDLQLVYKYSEGE